MAMIISRCYVEKINDSPKNVDENHQNNPKRVCKETP